MENSALGLQIGSEQADSGARRREELSPGQAF